MSGEAGPTAPDPGAPGGRTGEQVPLAPPDPAGRARRDAPVRDAEALAKLAAERCLELGLRLATAESCTGGLIGHLLTGVPGVSRVYVGGIVAYADATKRALLGVAEATLERHGAVSAQAGVAMAEGARRALGADVAVSVTGIAGPDGGTPAKPVGLTYVCCADARGSDVRRHVWPYDREGNKMASAAAALELLLERLASGSAPTSEG